MSKLLARNRRIFIITGVSLLIILIFHHYVSHLPTTRVSMSPLVEPDSSENQSTLGSDLKASSNLRETEEQHFEGLFKDRDNGTDIPPVVKPDGITVSGLVFYGRKDRVSSMRCYVERNMVDSGGWLDEVLWVANTDDAEDILYLDSIIASNPSRHKKIVIPGNRLSVYTYYKAWQHLDRGKYYVKIDDDIVWIADDAIPLLVTRKVRHPEDFVVSANIINNPPLGFMHYHMGAVHPYLPEIEKPTNISNSWRPSQQPFWKGPQDFVWSLDKKPPYLSHRWLRVEDDRMIAQTPAAQLKYEVWGDSYTSWSIAAQMHYSLLENIEQGWLDLYKFNKPWNMDGERIRINFMCVFADDILDTDIEQWPRNRGDEDMIVIDLPKQLRRPVVILGEALGAHFQYAGQPELTDTDLLGKYQALAQDQACLIK